MVGLCWVGFLLVLSPIGGTAAINTTTSITDWNVSASSETTAIPSVHEDDADSFTSRVLPNSLISTTTSIISNTNPIRIFSTKALDEIEPTSIENAVAYNTAARATSIQDSIVYHHTSVRTSAALSSRQISDDDAVNSSTAIRASSTTTGCCVTNTASPSRISSPRPSVTTFAPSTTETILYKTELLSKTPSVLGTTSVAAVTNDSVTLSTMEGVTMWNTDGITSHGAFSTSVTATHMATNTSIVTHSLVELTPSLIELPIASTTITVSKSSVTDAASTAPSVDAIPPSTQVSHVVISVRPTSVTVTPSRIPVTTRVTTHPPTTAPDFSSVFIEVSPQRITVGRDVELRCKSNFLPDSPFTWRHNGYQVSSGYSQQGLVSTLLLKNVTRKQGGTYTCETLLEIEATVAYAVVKASTILHINLSMMPTYPVPEEIPRTDSTITIPVHNVAFLSNGKKVEFIQFVVYMTTTPSFNVLAPDYYTPKRLESNESDAVSGPYIAAMIATSEGIEDQFVLGDGMEYPHLTARRRRFSRDDHVYHNFPLEPDAYYTAFQRVMSRDGDHESLNWMPLVRTTSATDMPIKRQPTNKIPLIMGLLAGLLLVIILAALVAVKVYKAKRGQPACEHDSEKYEMMAGNKNRLEKIARTFTLAGMKAHYRPCGPIHIQEFDDHVTRMRRSGDLFYSTEYERIPVPDHVTWTHTLDPMNQWKNRYINIVAYDHSRVKLQAFDDEPGSDYINANFLPGYRRDRAYIAAQGPIHETCRDFWRMIWEQNSRTIIMLTNLKERGRDKCAQYWPSHGCFAWEDIRVTLDYVTEMTPYIVRMFTVEREGCEESRQVCQFHFTSWPDHGVPTSVCYLLEFVRRASRADPPGAGPMTVHCSAGVGRTGTFIVIDAMLQQIKEEKTVDILGFVSSLRRHRNLMVQTEQQYIFTHDALLDAIISGVTELSVTELRSHVRTSQLEDSETGLTPMFTEFQKLSRCINPALTITAATLSVNKHKNRYANVLPYDSTRVHLVMQAGVEGSGYINANYIDGYMTKNAFIATQAPIPDTIPDFWRMVWEQNCCTIVALAQEVEQAKVKMHRYWPMDQPITFGSLVVEMQEKQQSDYLVTRVFKLTHAEESASRVVRQFHYTAWTEDTLSETGCQLLDVIGCVQNWQDTTANNVVVVHCSAGVGRTGVFCAVSTLIERLKAEAMVDVFQTVKQLREQRPAMVQTKGQYEFCYQVLLECLSSFDPLEGCDSNPGFPIRSELGEPTTSHTTPLLNSSQAPRQKNKSSRSDIYEETAPLKATERPSRRQNAFKIRNTSPPVSPTHPESCASAPSLADPEDFSEDDDDSDYEYTPVFASDKSSKSR